MCGERKGEKLSNFRGKRTDNAEVETLANNTNKGKSEINSKDNEQA